MLKELLNQSLLAVLIACGALTVLAQEKTDREKNGLAGLVKSVREESARIVIKNGAPVEKDRTLERVETYDIAGRKLTYYAYTDEGKVLYGDTYSYDGAGRLIETRTEHSKFTYLCDRYTHSYDSDGRLAEEICYVDGQGAMGKYVYRYDEEGRKIEREQIPIIVNKLYFGSRTLDRYKYDADGKLVETASFVREGEDWKPQKRPFDQFKQVCFSTDLTRVSTCLLSDDGGTLQFVETSLDDERDNEIETVKYNADGSIKAGHRYEYVYDPQGNYVKETDFEWTTEDGKSFFAPSEATYRKIEYFTEKEIREYKANNKPTEQKPANIAVRTAGREEYEVYNFLLEQWIVRNDIKTIVLTKFTDTDQVGEEKPLTVNDFSYLAKDTPIIDQAMVDDYNAKNFRRHTELVKESFGPKNKIALVSDAEANNFFSDSCNQGWKKFYEKYPTSPGMTTLSRVGFNADKTRALVYLGQQFACLGGTGQLIYLERQSGGWKIVKTRGLWIS